jgi:hypothetical protein
MSLSKTFDSMGRKPTEMSTGNIKQLMFLVSKVRQMRGADILTAIYEPIV